MPGGRRKRKRKRQGNGKGMGEESAFHPECKKCKVALDYKGAMGKAEIFKCPKCKKTIAVKR